MTLTVTTKLSALKLPAVVEKDGVRYKCDIADDDQGIDLVIERQEVSSSRSQVPGSKLQGTVKSIVAVLALMFATCAFADRTANQGWVRENFVSRTNEWKLAERHHALFIIDLNAENGGKWRAFELKASTNNFCAVSEDAKLCYWGCSDEADGYTDATVPHSRTRGEDKMRLYWLTTRGAADRDGRSWTKIGTTLDLTGANPKYLAALISPELCFDGKWLGEENEEVVWSYTRADASGSEKDTNGETLWNPIQPVKWFRDLPAWAK